MEEKIVNLTPHPLVIQRTCPRCNGQSCEDSQGECQQGIITETIESSGVARCAQSDREVGTFAGIPVVITEFGEVMDLPEPVPGTAYVVSSITAQACAGRSDVFVPSRPLRDEKGRIIGCAALGRIVG